MSRAQLKLAFIECICMLAIAGCAGMTKVKVPQFDESNQVFLEKTVAQLDIAAVAKRAAPVGSAIALVSMEKPGTIDHPLVAMIEDGLIESLRTAGYAVLERDDDMLRKLVAEKSSGGFKLVYPPSDIAGRPECPCRENVEAYETQLKGADYLVSYRVLEFGILYREGSKSSTAKREGILRLHVRVQDAKTGEVRLAERVKSTQTDEIDLQLVPGLADFHYAYYTTDSPLQNPIRTGFAVMEGKTVEPVNVRAGVSPMQIMLGVGGLVALLLILG